MVSLPVTRLSSPSPKTQAQGVKIRMNAAPRCIATTKNPLKTKKKNHTGKTNPAFTEQEAENHPHIRHCRQEIRMSQEKPTCQIRRHHPVLPQLPVATSNGGGPVPPAHRKCLWKCGLGCVLGVVKAGSRQPSDHLHLHQPPWCWGTKAAHPCTSLRSCCPSASCMGDSPWGLPPAPHWREHVQRCPELH